jgi:cyclomaltodextrinase
MTVPNWVPDAIFYQIFPDRFANGDPSNDPSNVEPWGSNPTNLGFQGGDLQGIIQRFDYLLDLGITAIYLNPIFQSPSNHRYNTYDYFQIDPKLGNMADFKSLLDLAHRNNIRIILDGVFNHCGRGFFAFNDLLENEDRSPYVDWFHTNKFPLDAFSPGEAENYAAWWKLKSLPKFNTINQKTRQYLFDIARYWIEQGIDGWRLDVPNEIDDDDFWYEFRRVVTNANKDAYLLGEIWTLDPRWLNDRHFDGLMHYPFREALLQLLNTGPFEMPGFISKIENFLKIYPRENLYSMYLPLGSHDTKRLLSKLEYRMDKAKIAFLFQFSFPGAPAIYYGDEIGMQGEKDPDCRRAFPWDQNSWNLELQHWVRTLISLRKRLPALRRGEFHSLLVESSNGLYGFFRALGDEKILVAMNASDHHQHMKIQASKLGWQNGRQTLDLFSNQKFFVIDDTLNIDLPPWSGTWLY